MGKSTQGLLIKGYTATTAIPQRTLVKFGAADGTVVPAAAATDLLIGCSSDLDTAVGERCDVFMNSCIAECFYGGTITRGSSVTSDATGKAIVAATGNRAVGFAEISGVAGDIGTIIVSPHTAA